MDTIVYMVEGADYEKATRDLSRFLTKGADKPGEPPTWWESDEEATQSGLAAARALGFDVDLS